MSVELRRLTIDPQIDPQLARMGTVVNRLVDMVNGSAPGRLWLLGDDGSKRAISGSAGVVPGATLSSNNYLLRVEPTSTNQVNVLHSNGSTVGLRVQDAGLTSGVPASLTSTLAVTGATTLTGALTANGGTTTTTLTVSGATLLNGAVTLGDNVADVITVTGTATFAEDVTMAKGLIVDTTTLVVDETTNKVGVLTATPGTTLEVAGAARVSAATGAPTTGAGLEFQYSGGSAVIQGFDRGGAAYRPVLILGSTVTIYGDGAAERIKVDGTGVGFNGATPVAPPSLPADATDDATVWALANAIKDLLEDNGLAS